MGICKHSADFFKPLYTEYVYSLRCPINYDIFYVGKTRDLKNRLNQHVNSAFFTQSNPYKNERIKQAARMGFPPIMREIDKTIVRTRMDSMLAFHKEVFWIQQYIEMGWDLTNVNSRNDADRTEYIRYMRMFKQNGFLPHYLFDFGKDDDGERVYDLLAIERYNVNIPYYKEDYSPYKNPIWMKKMGLVG